ncbi:MAG TPA: hypothetical protein VEZ47_09220, partial [Gemmatirosa sp.]|nr:hypothetical protein [Gemmatirosa sp.]
MPFIWFWTFWHWSREGHRTGALLRDPVHGLGSHWDEWYRHEASAEERRAIEETGRSARQQRLFMTWLVRHWAPGAEWRGERPPARFALWQLAGFSPFDGWTAFAPYRTIAGGRGVSAVVLAEHSAGEASDVRPVDALAIPADRDPAAPAVVAHGFSVAADELTTARQAVLRLLRGRGLLRLLVVWLVAGRRPYPRALRALLAAGWLGVCALIAWLLLGPEPGERLLSTLAAVLAALWGTLALAGIGTGAAVVLQAWRAGRALGGRLDRSQVRLRMDGGLTLVGGSAGVVFALTTLRAIGRGAVHARPRGQPRSWLWGRLVRALGPQAACWAATGVITA